MKMSLDDLKEKVETDLVTSFTKALATATLVEGTADKKHPQTLK